MNGRYIINSYIDDAESYASVMNTGVITPIKTDNPDDLSSLSSTNINNLLKPIPSVIWRSATAWSPSVTQLRIRVDIAGTINRGVNSFCLYNHNLGMNAQYKIRAYSTEAARDADTDGWQTGAKFDSGLLNIDDPQTIGYGTGIYGSYAYGGYSITQWEKYPFLALFLNQSYSYRWWNIFIVSGGVVEGTRLEVGRLMLSRYFEPVNNFDWGYSLQWNDPSRIVRTRGGALRSEYRTPYRVVEINYSWLTEADISYFLELQRLIGKRNEILWVAFPSDLTAPNGRRNVILGRLVDWSPVVRQRQGYSLKLTIEESI